MASALEVLYEQSALLHQQMMARTEIEGRLDYKLLHMQHFFLVEATAMFERVANFGQTGNARVMNTTLMDPFLLSAPARKGTLPFLGPNIKFNQTTGPLSFRIDVDRWPSYPGTMVPMTSSHAAFLFHYGKPFAEVSSSTICRYPDSMFASVSAAGRIQRS